MAGPVSLDKPYSNTMFQLMESQNNLIRIITTTSTREEAERIGTLLIEKGLAACVQVSGPILSIYPWKGKIERDEEWVLSVKTLERAYEGCKRLIIEKHSYECPQLIAFSAKDVFEPYLDWVKGWIEERTS